MAEASKQRGWTTPVERSTQYEHILQESEQRQFKQDVVFCGHGWLILGILKHEYVS